MILAQIKTKIRFSDYPGEEPDPMELVDEDLKSIVCFEELIEYFDFPKDLDSINFVWLTAHDRPSSKRVRVEDLRFDSIDTETFWTDVLVGEEGEQQTIGLEFEASKILQEKCGNKTVIYIEIEWE